MRGGVGSITAITASSVTVKSQQGGTKTILTTSKTVYVEAMSVVPRTDLKVGENIGVLARPVSPPAGRPGSWSAPGTTPAPASSGSGSATTSAATASPKPTEPTAVAIEILVPRLDGRVVSVSSGKVVVEDPSGLQQTIVTTSATTYRELNTTVPASAVTAGENVVGFGTVATDHTQLDASTVAIVGPLVGGRVTGVSGSTITVRAPRGTVRISTSGSTIFRSNGGASSLAKIKTGDLVIAVGMPSGTSGFAASGIWFGTLSAAGGTGIGGIGGIGGVSGLGVLGGIGGLGGVSGLGAAAGGPLGIASFAGGGGFGGAGTGGFGRFGHGLGGLTRGKPASSAGSSGSGSGTTTT
jgi:hypothetical protein